MLVIRPARSGNSRLTRLGKSTLPSAIAAPSTAVPENSAATAPAERRRMPAASTSMLASSTRSMPKRPANRGAMGERTPIAKSGRAVSSPATPWDMPASAWIWPINGATPVSAGRRLAARSTNPKTSSTPRTRKRRRWSGRSGTSFVTPRLPGRLSGWRYEHEGPTHVEHPRAVPIRICLRRGAHDQTVPKQDRGGQARPSTVVLKEGVVAERKLLTRESPLVSWRDSSSSPLPADRPPRTGPRADDLLDRHRHLLAYPLLFGGGASPSRSKGWRGEKWPLWKRFSVPLWSGTDWGSLPH